MLQAVNSSINPLLVLPVVKSSHEFGKYRRFSGLAVNQVLVLHRTGVECMMSKRYRALHIAVHP